MQIIQYTQEMDSAIYNFIQKVFKENSRKFCPTGKDSDILNISEHYIKYGNFWCLVDEKKEICGTIALRKLQDCHEIRRFFVLEKYQGCGYGTNLLNIAVNYAIDNNYTMLKAATLSNGFAAQHIFSVNGFTRTERYNNSTADIFLSLK